MASHPNRSRNPIAGELRRLGWGKTRTDLSGYACYFKLVNTGGPVERRMQYVYLRGEFWVHRHYPVNYMPHSNLGPVINLGRGFRSFKHHFNSL